MGLFRKSKSDMCERPVLPWTANLTVLKFGNMAERMYGLRLEDKDGTEICTVCGDKQFFRELAESLLEHIDDIDEWNGKPA